MKYSLKIYSLLITANYLIASNLVMAQNNLIEQVFSYNMLGADLTYLESFIGPARRTDTYDNTKKYIVKNCEITVGYSGHSINSLTLDVITPECSFDLNVFFGGKEPMPVNQLVFGELGPVTYYADCLTGCGNSYDPAVYELYKGSRAENHIEVLTSTISSYESESPWRETMIKKEGEEWVGNNQYNCQPEKYYDLAASALKGEKIEKITIGYGLEEKKQLRWGCDNSD